MGSIRTGDKEASLLRLGDAEVYAVYAGEERAWPGEETRLWLHLTSNTSITLYTSQNSLLYTSQNSLQTVVDWGDGRKETYTGTNKSHAYDGPGDYRVAIRPKDTARAALGMGMYNNLFGIGVGDGKTGTSPELIRLEIGGLVNGIVDYSFGGCTSLRAVTVPEGVLSIGTEAFVGCAGLVLAEIGAHRLAGTDVLKNCPALQKLWLRESVDTIVANSLRDIGPTGALTIYCEADEKPASWPEGWNAGGFPVVWGQKARPW